MADVREMDFSAMESQMLSLRKHDLLVCEGGEIGRTAILPEDLPGVHFQNSLHRVRPRLDSLAPKFLMYSMWAAASAGAFDRDKATIGHLTGERLRRHRFPVPPPDEQRAIAWFLDEETSKIDLLIAKKRELSEMYETRFDRLADRLIRPQERRLERLRHVAGGVTVGVVVNPSTYVHPQGTIPFFRGINVKRYSLSVDSAEKITEASNRILHKSRLKAGDIVTVRVGDPGISAVVPIEAEGSNCASLLITRQGTRADNRYLCHVFNSSFGQSQFHALAYGAAQKVVNVSHAIDFRVPMPSIEEQRRIANCLDAEWEKVTKLRAAIARQMGLLQEYRSALITAAVTGQIDVTKAA